MFLLKKVVQKRARTLKASGVGYLNAVRQIAGEVADFRNGGTPPIANEMGVVGLTPAEVGDFILSVLKILLPWFREYSRQQELERVSQEIDPWIAEVYEAA